MGFAPAGLKPPGGFRRNLLLRGYDPEAADRFFAALDSEAAATGLRVLPVSVAGASAGDADRPPHLTGWAWQQYESDCHAEWRRISDLPGLRLHMTGSKVTGNSGEVLLTSRGGTRTLTTGQELRIVPQSLDPSTTPEWRSSPHGHQLR
jgi:hypothetical protein